MEKGVIKSMSEKIVYISGAITGTKDYMERFGAAEKTLKYWGYKPINPAKTNSKLPEDTTWAGYMRASIRLLMKADAIYMIRGWRKSKGAALEHLIAKALGMEIITDL